MLKWIEWNEVYELNYCHCSNKSFYLEALSLDCGLSLLISHLSLLDRHFNRFAILLKFGQTIEANFIFRVYEKWNLSAIIATVFAMFAVFL